MTAGSPDSRVHLRASAEWPERHFESWMPSVARGREWPLRTVGARRPSPVGSRCGLCSRARSLAGARPGTTGPAAGRSRRHHSPTCGTRGQHRNPPPVTTRASQHMYRATTQTCRSNACDILRDFEGRLTQILVLTWARRESSHQDHAPAEVCAAMVEAPAEARREIPGTPSLLSGTGSSGCPRRSCCPETGAER
jgi:hypothetical protein